MAGVHVATTGLPCDEMNMRLHAVADPRVVPSYRVPGHHPKQWQI